MANMKRQLGCRHYGRYVDDFYVVSNDRDWLLSLVPQVRTFLDEELGLSFHDGKLQVSSVWHGVEFLGTWLKPRRIYASHATVGRMRNKLHLLANNDRSKWFAALNSYCGVLSHWNNYRLRRSLLTAEPAFGTYGMFNMEYTKYDCFEARVYDELANDYDKGVQGKLRVHSKWYTNALWALPRKPQRSAELEQVPLCSR